MTKTSLALAALVAIGAAGSANATPLASSKPMQSYAAQNSGLEQVYWGAGRCKAWRHECAERWGWGTWRFKRCLIRHACF